MFFICIHFVCMFSVCMVVGMCVRSDELLFVDIFLLLFACV